MLNCIPLSNTYGRDYRHFVFASIPDGSNIYDLSNNFKLTCFKLFLFDLLKHCMFDLSRCPLTRHDISVMKTHLPYVF